MCIEYRLLKIQPRKDNIVGYKKDNVTLTMSNKSKDLIFQSLKLFSEDKELCEPYTVDRISFMLIN